MATTETKTPSLPAGKASPPQPAHPALRNRRWSGYRHLLWVRILELKREPEVVFWVFVFPLLLAAGLGIAFRNKPADITSVVVIDNAGAQKTLAMLQSPPAKTRPIKTRPPKIRPEKARAIPPFAPPSSTARPRSKPSTSASMIWPSKPTPTAATPTITTPPGRRASYPAPKSMPISKLPPAAKTR